MAEAFGVASGIVGVISLTIQISQVAIQFGLDWKDAPRDVRTFMTELQALKTVLSETNTNITLNPDFADAFQDRHSALLSHLGPAAPPTTDTKRLLEICQTELEDLLIKLKKREDGRRWGWERFKGALLAKNVQESVQNLHRHCQVLNSLVSIDTLALSTTIYKDLNQSRKEQIRWHQSEENEKILSWLTGTDYGAQQSDTLSRRQAGTGQWILETEEFLQWVNNKKRTIFCSGIPGAGKTILTSIVTDHLQQTFEHNTRVGIAYLYCKFRQQQEQSPLNLLLSLLKQLVQGQETVPESLKDLYERHVRRGSRPTVDEIASLLQSVTTGYAKTFVVIDALDECSSLDGGRQKLVEEIFRLQTKAEVNIFATSRPVEEIERSFKECAFLKIQARDEDIQSYLEGNMFRLPPFVSRDRDLQMEIKSSISKAVNGMFLLAQLYFDSLTGKRSPKMMRNTLQKLPSGSGAYDYAYQEAMERIQSQDIDSQELAMQVLGWITCAKQPLKAIELQHALAVEIGSSQFDPANVSDTEFITSVCAGLVTVDDKSNIIRLVHYTTQEYFQRTMNKWFSNMHRDIGTVCVTYLSFHIFEIGYCLTDEDFETRLHQYPLYSYAARNWGHHCHAQLTEEQLVLVLDLLRNEAKIAACAQALLTSRSFPDDHEYSQRAPRQVTGVHLASYFGLSDILQHLLENGDDANVKNSKGRTPLSWAAEHGYEKVAMLLLEKGVDLESKDEYGQTPLSLAAQNGHDKVVKLLLEKGVDLESKDEYGQSPLSWASRNGHDKMVKLLLEKGVDLESKDTSYGQTPLSWAAENGHDKVVKLLLEKGVDLESKDIYGQTPLSWAAQNGHDKVVKLLLEKRVDLESKDRYGQTPLSLAAQNDHDKVVKLLLEKGADLESKDENGRTPFSWAAQNRREKMARLLLEKGVDLESKDIYGQTPLSLAAQNDHDKVVKLLLEKGADLESKDENGRTLLSWAAGNGHVRVVKLLLEKGADPESKDQYGRTPLMWATAYKEPVVVALLLSKTAVNPNLQDKFGRTALSAAAVGGHVLIMKLLLAKKTTDPNIKDIFGRTPLSDAESMGNLDVVRLLLGDDEEIETPINDEAPHIKASTRQYQGLIHCDICLVTIPDTDFHYHCPICSSEGFDICQICLESGAVCLEPSHKLAKRVMRIE